ncbi:DUF368 domain-containing protein [Flavobacterium okayamense]|uniref:DUF368 domain-containing protein n=1 Tax=Flavobacterium okayamense TaxID=2830782 RepID=A0ABM7S5E3_9FLAO|nr:DUF368 domain-containing protein [Flavobacterium okayamense]BCY28694.1 DUF368 domain-containing protein [Flavobacterium okayamense]
MRKLFPDYILIFLKGLAMGAADVVPGVSGGTIAFISGIYQELINSINRINLDVIKHLRQNGLKATWGAINGNFLLALGIGIATSLFTFSIIITNLLKIQPILVWSFFFGLVLASILFIWKEITHWSPKSIISLLIGTILSFYITIAEPTHSPDSYIFLFLSGFIAIIAMILPGISGAFILLLIGSYATIFGSFNDIKNGLISGNFDVISTAILKLGTVALGALLGLKLFSKVLTWMFAHHKNTTLALLIGFMIGSLNKIWPWKEVLETRLNSHGETVPFIERSILPQNFDGEPKIILAIIMVIIGFLLIFGLEKIAYKLGKK